MSEEKTCFLVLTMSIDRRMLSFCRQLQKATRSLGDVIILYHQTNETVPVVPGFQIHTFTNSVLHDLGFKPLREQLVPGSNHFPVLQFYRAHPEYSYYWCIEDDVRFRGNWSNFFNQVQQGLAFDLVTSHIRRYPDEPGWFWWQHLVAPEGAITKEELLASFNPIYRISRRGLKLINDCLTTGWSGHHEVIIPSILRKNGMLLADLGSKTNHVTQLLRFCTLRTMRWKPVVLITGVLPNKLYHPVKSRVSYGQIKTYVKSFIKNRMKYVMK